jgi:hypothetical protein
VARPKEQSAQEAVAAAALISAQCPDGEPTDTGYGLEEPMPAFPADLRTLAAEALNHILDDQTADATPVTMLLSTPRRPWVPHLNIHTNALSSCGGVLSGRVQGASPRVHGRLAIMTGPAALGLA